MDVLQTLLRDRYELALVVGRARRLGIPLHLSGPQHVTLAVAHAVDVALQLLVGVDRHVACEVVVRACVVEKVVTAIFGVGSALQQMSQHRCL